MSIKKIPVCPFCKTEMKHKRPENPRDEHKLIVAYKYEEGASKSPIASDIFNVTDWMRIEVWECESCEFIALFRESGPQ